MHPEIERIQREFTDEIQKVGTSLDLEAVQVKFLGRKGPVQGLMGLLKSASAEERPLLGKAINDLKEHLQAECDRRLERLILLEQDEQLEKEKIDITLPGRRREAGRKHPITFALDRVIDILVGMGFSVQYGPDIDTDYYNFEVLNFPKDHPARDMHDTFYITEELLLRTHTSNVQARVMEKERLPIRVIAPGKAYRNESISARSHVFFHQVEGFYVDKNVTFADLFSTLDEFLAKLFGGHIETRYRPSYFPFVEPGMEVDVSCLPCEGHGCPLCKHTGWLEIAGAGMIHPEVLKNCGIDPEEYSGFAWGMGLDRLVLIEKSIPDIRLFMQNDLRFLRQFAGV